MVSWIVVGLGAGCAAPSPNLVLTDEHNYSFTGSVDFGQLDLAVGADITFCYDALTTTLRGNPMPAAPQELLFAKFSLDLDTLTEKITDGTLTQSDSPYQTLLANPGACGVLSSTMSVLDNPHDPVAEHLDDGGIWLATVRDITPRADILMSKVVTFSDASTATEVAFTDDCSSANFTADLHSPSMVDAPKGEDQPITFDWSGLENDANGKAFDPLLPAELVVGKLGDLEVADAEASFMRLYEVAEELYTVDVYGVTAWTDLSALVDASGAAFGGFDKGLWFIAINCTDATQCLSPTPLFLTLVDVR